MAKVEFSVEQIDLPHAQMVRLRREGRLNLGINDAVAVKLAEMGIRPKGTAQAAFYLFNALAVGALGLGLYWAFTRAWWWGVVGFVVMFVIVGGNKRGHAENLLDAAMFDAEFYERVRNLKGWRYQIDEETAATLTAKD